MFNRTPPETIESSPVTQQPERAKRQPTTLNPLPWNQDAEKWIEKCKSDPKAVFYVAVRNINYQFYQYLCANKARLSNVVIICPQDGVPIETLSENIKPTIKLSAAFKRIYYAYEPEHALRDFNAAVHGRRIKKQRGRGNTQVKTHGLRLLVTRNISDPAKAFKL